MSDCYLFIYFSFCFSNCYPFKIFSLSRQDKVEMAFHATPKNGGLLFFIRASILPILIATIFLMQLVLTEAG
jgi:hypothetical protein